MRIQRVQYPRFMIYKDHNKVPEGWTWFVQYFNPNMEDTRVFNGETAQECWDFVSEYPRKFVSRSI